MPRSKGKNAVLAGLFGVAVSAVGTCAQKNPVAPPFSSPLTAPPTCTLTAEPPTVERGYAVVGLSWTSQNATDMDLQPGVGKVKAEGSITVNPVDSTTYTMIAKGPGGIFTCTTEVEVTVARKRKGRSRFWGVPPPPPPPEVKSVAWSPDGTRLARGSNDGTVKVWDADTGNELLTTPSLAEGVFGIAWSPDGKRLAGAGGKVKVWDAITGKELLAVEFARPAYDVAWSPDGRRLATAGWGGIKVLDAETGNESLTPPELGEVVSRIAWSPDGKRLAGAGDKVKVWDAKTGKELLSLNASSSVVAWTPDGKRLATGDGVGTVTVWDAEAGKGLLTPPVGLGAAVDGVALSPDGKRLAAAGDGVKVWDMGTGKELVTLGGAYVCEWGGVYLGSAAVFCVAWSPDGKRLATGMECNTTKVWDAETGKELLTLKGPAR